MGLRTSQAVRFASVSQFVDGALHPPGGSVGRQTVDLFVRSYQTLLRSTAKCASRGCSSHIWRWRRACTRERPNRYQMLRRSPMSGCACRRACRAYAWCCWAPRWTAWPRVVPPTSRSGCRKPRRARRRRHFFDGRDRLAVLVSSPSDLDDIIPALVAYEMEWNKLHELLDRDHALRRLVQRAAREGPQPGRPVATVRCAGAVRSRDAASGHRLGRAGVAAAGERRRPAQEAGGPHAERHLERLRTSGRALAGVCRRQRAAGPDAAADLPRLEQHAQPAKPALGFGDGPPGGHHRLHPRLRQRAAAGGVRGHHVRSRAEQPRKLHLLRRQEVPGGPTQLRASQHVRGRGARGRHHHIARAVRPGRRRPGDRAQPAAARSGSIDDWPIYRRWIGWRRATR